MILYLHDILPNPDEIDLKCSRLSTENFVRVLNILRRDYEWIGWKEYEALRLSDSLKSSHICLSFDDASVTLEPWLVRLKEERKDCALMVATSPYLESMRVLPHQLIEALHRNQGLDLEKLRPIKKSLKKSARLRGHEVYLDFINDYFSHDEERVNQFLKQSLQDIRFQFLSEGKLRELGSFHSLIHHGHFHTPLGSGQCENVVDDQVKGSELFATNSYALPFGDLEGQLPIALSHFSAIYGTEGPYEDQSVIPRISAQAFLERH